MDEVRPGILKSRFGEALINKDSNCGQFENQQKQYVKLMRQSMERELSILRLEKKKTENRYRHYRFTLVQPKDLFHRKIGLISALDVHHHHHSHQHYQQQKQQEQVQTSPPYSSTHYFRLSEASVHQCFQQSKKQGGGVLYSSVQREASSQAPPSTFRQHKFQHICDNEAQNVRSIDDLRFRRLTEILKPTSYE